MLGIAFEDEEASKLNTMIFETIYHAAMTASNQLAIRDGPYQSFEGSPLS
jgi:ribonucleoside-diphosphate reductase alpha chain